VAGTGSIKQKGIKYVPEKLIKYRQHTNVSGGAETMKLDTLVSGSLNKGFMNDRIDKNTKLLNWYRGVYSFHKLDSKEKRIVEDMIYYHQSFFDKRIRIKAFLIHLKYFRLLYPHYRFFTRLLILFTSLIGVGKRQG
jgi:hypothetical protein